MGTRTRTVRGLAVSLLLAGLTVTATTDAVAQKTPAAAGPRSRSDALAVSLSARVASEPAYVLVRTRLEPDPANRMLTIEWWSDEGVGGSHAVPLEGDREAIQHVCAIKDMASGEYTVTAILTRNDRSEVRRQARIVVVGPGNQLDAATSSSLTNR